MQKTIITKINYKQIIGAVKKYKSFAIKEGEGDLLIAKDYFKITAEYQEENGRYFLKLEQVKDGAFLFDDYFYGFMLDEDKKYSDQIKEAILKCYQDLERNKVKTEDIKVVETYSWGYDLIKQVMETIYERNYGNGYYEKTCLQEPKLIQLDNSVYLDYLHASELDEIKCYSTLDNIFILTINRRLEYYYLDIYKKETLEFVYNVGVDEAVQYFDLTDFEILKKLYCLANDLCFGR